MVFAVFGFFFVGKVKTKISSCFYEITISENPSNIPLKEACSGSQVLAACDSE
jgi:hypothetical protein